MTGIYTTCSEVIASEPLTTETLSRLCDKIKADHPNAKIYGLKPRESALTPPGMQLYENDHCFAFAGRFEDHVSLIVIDRKPDLFKSWEPEMPWPRYQF